MNVATDFAAIDLENQSTFISIDIELANWRFSSICQIGVVEFVDGKPANEWMTYVDPEDSFGAHNISIHGITEPEVRGWPKIPEISERLNDLLNGKIVVSHSGTDKAFLESAFDRYGLTRLECIWLDTVLVVQRAWAGFAKRGYGLQNICKLLEYRYHSHDALGDARGAGVVLLAAIEQTGITLGEWVRKVELPAGEGPRVPIQALGRQQAEFYGSNDEAPSRQATRPGNPVLDAEILQALSKRFGQETGD